MIDSLRGVQCKLFFGGGACEDGAWGDLWLRASRLHGGRHVQPSFALFPALALSISELSQSVFHCVFIMQRMRRTLVSGLGWRRLQQRGQDTP
eukprot:5527433-Pyramimonas_sp.AAC.1